LKKILNSLNGEFRIESEISKGTTMILELPYDIDVKSKILDETKKLLESKLNKYKNSNISSVINDKEQEDIRKNIFKNTEINFLNINTLKSEYGIYDESYFESN